MRENMAELTPVEQEAIDGELMRAAGSGDVTEAESAIERGASTEDIDEIMYLAAYHGHTEVCELAKRHGAMAFGAVHLIAGKRGHRALADLADEWKSAEIETVLAKKETDWGPWLGKACVLFSIRNDDSFLEIFRIAARLGRADFCNFYLKIWPEIAPPHWHWKMFDERIEELLDTKIDSMRLIALERRLPRTYISAGKWNASAVEKERYSHT